MRKFWCVLGLTSSVFWLSGCKTDTLLRPPKNPVYYNLPPDEKRYTTAPDIPKEDLNVDPGAAKRLGDPDANPAGKMGGAGTSLTGH